MPALVVLTDEMLFGSRVAEAARGAGIELRTARTADQLLAAAGEGTPLVVVDADSARVPWQAALGALRAEPRFSTIPVVAFYSHVHAERASSARAAGANHVLPRGALARELPRLLRSSAGASEEDHP